MEFLFDASAIVNLTKKGLVEKLASGATLDLAVYEAINAVWKECRILGRFSEEDASELTQILSQIFAVIDVLSIRGGEGETLEVALIEGITAYDAAYLHMATKNKLVLVTDDAKLRGKASGVKAISSKEFAEISLP